MEWSNLGSTLLASTSTGARALLYSAMNAKEESERTSVLSGTCGVQNAVITNSGAADLCDTASSVLA